MRNDALNGGIPKRLIQHEGAWILEVQRLVALDSTVFRPHTQRLEGPEQIAAYFRRNPQAKNLAAGLQRLLQTASNLQTRSFEAVGGEWVPAPLAPDYVAKLRRRVRADAAKDTAQPMLELKTELFRLRSALAEVQHRVAELEAAAKQGNGISEEALEAILAQRAQAAAEEEQEAPDSSSAEVAPAAAEPEPSQPEPSEDEVVAAAEAAAQAKKRRRLKLPEMEDVSRCLQQLLGTDISTKVDQDPEQFSAESGAFYVTRLVDDQGYESGAILLDLKATVFLGGTLMMIPTDILNEQVENGEPSEDSLEASAEVCNSLTGATNKVMANIHVRAKPLERFDFETVPWAATPHRRVDLVDSLGGRIVLLSQ